ncbi:NfeD family protein [Oleiagrimonas soli]|uniref:Serine protease n=1 Tax=Oleiagrimonas soli TaxID=1543381 RepID=A0A099CW77_9GAMM|nr:nodulation protein NfeD [Oleiagrimonas soli]KGI78223.1 serine protease [Oleiagrimonas soli]MBB6183314.1 membrane-bound serine protease (ClpP class) [Oleiagrimonas soli]
MKYTLCLMALMLTACVTAIAVSTPAHAQQADGPGFVAQIDLDGPIGPAAAEYVNDRFAEARRDGARAIVLRLDTPGGLSASMRTIIADILASDIPVIAYVAPGGARAASAGTYILYASHLAAMAPATHLGAATPVSLGGKTPMPNPLQPEAKPAASASAPAPAAGADAESNKVLNDAIAYIRSLAQLRGRNAAWAEKAVRGAATLTADEAARDHVIDFVAPDIASLLKQADGRRVRLGETDAVVRVAGLPVRVYEPGWRTRFLGIITNPTIAYLLLIAGLYGLLLEAFHPGALFPGIAGAICLLIGLYALQLLPVNYAGLALMALGVGLVVAEVITPTVGALGVGGVIAFTVGSIMLFHNDAPGFGVNVGVIAGLALCAIVTLGGVLWMVMRSRRVQPFNGDTQLADPRGELLEPLTADGEAWARINGERWRVRSESHVELPNGAHVRARRRDGLILWVEAD